MMAMLTTLNGTKKLNLHSYICRGYNASNFNYIVNLSDDCDVLFQQEHWLADVPLDSFNHISPHFLDAGVISFLPTDFLARRRGGGCSIFW